MSNPILQRELITALRAPRSAWTIIVVATLLSLLVLLLWPQEGSYSIREQSSHMLLNTVTLGGLLLALLIAPAFTATCLTSEKENASYDLLTHTLLKPRQIAQGKVLSSLGLLLIVLLSTLPALGSTLLLGGTEPLQLAAFFGLILAATIATGLIGFAVSAWSRESFTALVITYTIMLSWVTIPLIAPILLPKMVIQFPWLGDGAFVSPLATLLGILHPEFSARASLPTNVVRALPIYFASCAIISFVAWNAGKLRLHFQRFDTRPAPPSPARERSLWSWFGSGKRSPIGNWSNVILAKELRSRSFAQGRWITRGMYATFALSLLLVILVLRGGATLHFDMLKVVMVSFQVLVVVLITPSLLSGSYTQEVEQRQFDLLRQTLIRPHTFLFGKTFSAWILMMLLLVASVPMWWMMAYLENYQWISTLVSLAVVMVTLLLASSLSLVASLVAPTTASATAMAYGVLSIFAFGTLAPLIMGESLSPSLRETVLACNPFAAALQAVSMEYLKNDSILWKTYLLRSLFFSAFLLLLAWGLLWNKLRRQS